MDSYPFGLTMQGISSRAAQGDSNPENRKKYNGIELENDLELQTYDAFFRELDPQTGRWWQVDPKTENMEMWSSYASNYDNPLRYSDPLGDEGQECCWDELKEAVDIVLISATGVVNGMLNTGSGGLIPTDPLKFRDKLNGDKLALYDRSVEVGQVGPLIMSGVPTARTPTPSLQPVNGSPVAVPTTVNPTLVVPMSTSQHGGGKNDQHANQKARESAKEKYEAAKKQYQDLNSKPNKTKEDIKARDQAEKQMKHWKQKMDNTGENHSRKAKGSN
jgi:RHS repeat-associated protein